MFAFHEICLRLVRLDWWAVGCFVAASVAASIALKLFRTTSTAERLVDRGLLLIVIRVSLWSTALAIFRRLSLHLTELGGLIKTVAVVSTAILLLICAALVSRHREG